MEGNLAVAEGILADTLNARRSTRQPVAVRRPSQLQFAQMSDRGTCIHFERRVNAQSSEYGMRRTIVEWIQLASPH